MSISTWFRIPRVRRGLAASAVVLAAGGLVLARAPAHARPAVSSASSTAATAKGQSSTPFSAAGAHGTLSLSHTKVLAGGEQRIFAEIELAADRGVEDARERAPLSLAVVLDTSGSMSGEKIEQAKQSVIGLVRDMRDDDEIAFVRYASDTQLVQPLARVGAVRKDLIASVQRLEAGGGTNIPPALSQGLLQLSDAAKGRVRRVVLVSDGLDSTRALSEQIAHESAGRGITVSSMGIGLDFDEGYMGGVARSGHGNFAFVKDASALAAFLQKELKETASTTVERAVARLKLPSGVRFVQAVGADAKQIGEGGSELELSLGSLFAGDERRVIVQLAAKVGAGEVLGIEGQVGWRQVGGDSAEVRMGRLEFTGTTDAQAVEEGRDGKVFASAVSAMASIQQLAATEAYDQGDGAKARAIIQQNIADLNVAATAAPVAAAPLAAQAAAYATVQQEFAAAPPSSDRGKVAAKAAASKDMGNLDRAMRF
jgi:Ca-activated chloride channel homolog